MLALLLAACLQTDIKELTMPFECPDKVLQVRVSGNHELIEEYVRVDIDRADIPSTSVYPLRTVDAANAALKAYHWIRERYEVAEFSYTIEDQAGQYICAVRIKSNEDETDQVLSGDCAGAGKGGSDKPNYRPMAEPGPTEGDIES